MLLLHATSSSRFRSIFERPPTIRSTTVVFRFGLPPKRDVILLVMDETMICNPNTYSYTRIQTQSN